MNLELYSVYDRVAGIYGEPFAAVNKETAVRRFNYTMSNAPMVSADCELYKVGVYNTVVGDISAQKEFVCKFEVTNDEKA